MSLTPQMYKRISTSTQSRPYKAVSKLSIASRSYSSTFTSTSASTLILKVASHSRPRSTRPSNATIVSKRKDRSFFTLPDLSKFSPLSQRNDQGGVKGKGKSVTLKDGSQLYTEQKVLPYSSTHLYSIVSDVDSYSQFLPYCLDSTVLESNSVSNEGSTEEVKTVQARLTVGFGAFKESYVSNVEMKDGQWVRASALPSNPLFKTLHTTWQFHPQISSNNLNSFPSQRSSSNSSSSSNETQVSFSLKYSFSNPIYGAVASNTFESMAGKMMEAFEKRARATSTSQ